MQENNGKRKLMTLNAEIDRERTCEHGNHDFVLHRFHEIPIFSCDLRKNFWKSWSRAAFGFCSSQEATRSNDIEQLRRRKQDTWKLDKLVTSYKLFNREFQSTKERSARSSWKKSLRLTYKNITALPSTQKRALIRSWWNESGLSWYTICSKKIFKGDVMTTTLSWRLGC